MVFRRRQSLPKFNCYLNKHKFNFKGPEAFLNVDKDKLPSWLLSDKRIDQIKAPDGKKI